MTIFTPRIYQQKALNYLVKHPCSALLADPGTGKTSIMLALIKWLRNTEPSNRILVVSLRSVILEAWPGELEKWDQFRTLKHSIIQGPRRIDAALSDADFYLINPELLTWAQATGLLSTFDTVVVDESSIIKNPGAMRTKILCKLAPGLARRHIMTGSPTPNSLRDYFSQQYFLDQGRALGKSITAFERKWLIDVAPKGVKYSKWAPRHGAFEAVCTLVEPSVFRLDGEKLLELPELVYNDLAVQLSSAVLTEYRTTVKASRNAALAFLAARQMAGGFWPDNKGMLHEAKLHRLERLVDELSGEPLVIFFSFRAEGEAIAARFRCPLVYGGTTGSSQTFASWNRGELPVVALSPAVCGHGLNLQDGGHHVCWYSLPTNQDHYFQANRRLRRQGQAAPRVFVHRLMAATTVDATLSDMLMGKADAQFKFLDSFGFLPEEIRDETPKN